MTAQRAPAPMDPIETPPTTQSGVQSRIELKIDALHTKVSRIEEYVMGPFGASHKGLDARVREIEQSEKDRKRWIGAALIATLGAAATTLWNIVTTGKAHS